MGIKKISSQSGFMSVEAIATTLFYLIMVAVIAAIAAQVISSGKMASTLNALGVLRVNVQYVGANLSGYSSVDSTIDDPEFNIHAYVQNILRQAAKTYYLPTSHLISVFPAQTGDINPDSNTPLTSVNNSLFTMQIVGLLPNDCRRIAYYALGGGYGITTTSANTFAKADGGNAAITANNLESKCGTDSAVSLHLTSK